MRDLLMVSVTIVISALAVPACSSDSNYGKPRIAFEQEYVHLGEATPDQRIDYTFTFENVGDAPLMVQAVKIRTLEGC